MTLTRHHRHRLIIERIKILEIHSVLIPLFFFCQEDDVVDHENGDNESECSCPAGREGSAFPKAFERDLVTPTNLTVSQNTSRQTSVEENASHEISKEASLEEKKDGDQSVSIE